MTITVPSVQITGTQEAIIRDNVENPDTNLGERALTQLVAPFRSATLQRAQAAYRETFNADAEAVLPNMLNDAAVIEWYLAREGYKDATERAQQARVGQIGNEIASLTSERGRHEQRRAALPQDAAQDLVDSINATIEALTAQITALIAERDGV